MCENLLCELHSAKGNSQGEKGGVFCGGKERSPPQKPNEK